MSYTTEQIKELEWTARMRWPDSIAAGSLSVWEEWSKSLDPRVAFEDVMQAIVDLGEKSEKFPPLARLLEVAGDLRYERMKALEPPPQTTHQRPRPSSIEARLAAFDEDAAGREIGPWETKCREWLARGIDPGVGAKAFVDQFIANSYGDVERGLKP
jgi:hypothetical protein